MTTELHETFCVLRCLECTLPHSKDHAVYGHTDVSVAHWLPPWKLVYGQNFSGLEFGGHPQRHPQNEFSSDPNHRNCLLICSQSPWTESILKAVNKDIECFFLFCNHSHIKYHLMGTLNCKNFYQLYGLCVRLQSSTWILICFSCYWMIKFAVEEYPSLILIIFGLNSLWNSCTTICIPHSGGYIAEVLWLTLNYLVTEGKGCCFPSPQPFSGE